MKKHQFWLGIGIALALISIAAVHWYTDVPNNPNPLGTYAISMDTQDHAPGGTPYNWISIDQLSARIGSASTAGFLRTNNDTGYSETFALGTTFTGSGNNVELGSGTHLVGDIQGGTNLQSALVLESADPLQPNARTLAAGANITLTDSGPGGTLAISSSGTNVVNTVTNNTFVNTNVMILQSNATFTIKKGATLVIETNAFLIDSNITASSAVITTARQDLTNAVNAHGAFTNSTSGPPSFGLLQNTELQNSSLTIAGTANQVSVSGGGPVSLGATATLSLPSPTIFPGKIAVTGITNTGETSLQGVETNTTMGTGLVHSDNLGKRSSSLLVNADITAGTIANASLANSSITIQNVAVSLGGSTLAQGSKPVFDLQSSTNLLLSSISSPTNGVSTASSIDFTLPEAVTNIAGAVSQTSLLNFNQTNINHAIRYYVNRTGSDQTITVGTWETDSARQTATTYICTNNTTLALMFSMYAGQFTNVTSYKTFR